VLALLIRSVTLRILAKHFKDEDDNEGGEGSAMRLTPPAGKQKHRFFARQPPDQSIILKSAIAHAPSRAVSGDSPKTLPPQFGTPAGNAAAIAKA
jgi:hypothetical protein